MNKMKSNIRLDKSTAWRQYFILGVLLVAFIGLGLRVVQLQTTEHDHLRAQGDARFLRELSVPPQRGRILDRNGRVLAVSTPVNSLWAEPSKFCQAQAQWPALLTTINTDKKTVHDMCARRKGKRFMYIQRGVPPLQSEAVLQLSIPGVKARREYRRYYPAGPAGAHLVGFTNIDDVGQEGLERAYQNLLGGVPGKIRVLKDRAGNYVESVESIRQVQHGEDLVISIDQRIQSLAGDYLAAAIRKHRAAAGSVVVLGIPSGEILAMVNSPQFNPNDRRTITGGKFRNRSVTDILEPGSTTKPFTIALA